MGGIDGRGLVFYSLISLVAFLWAGFVYQEGIMSWISLVITLMVLIVSLVLLLAVVRDILKTPRYRHKY